MEYLDEIKRLINVIETEEIDNIHKASNIIADAIKGNNTIYTFGASHAGIFSEELFYRAGGIALFNPIFGSEVVLNTRPITHTSKMESLDGYGTLLGQKVNFNKGAKETQWRKASVSTNGAGTIEVCMQKIKKEELGFIHQN